MGGRTLEVAVGRVGVVAGSLGCQAVSQRYLGAGTLATARARLDLGGWALDLIVD